MTATKPTAWKMWIPAGSKLYVVKPDGSATWHTTRDRIDVTDEAITDRNAKVPGGSYDEGWTAMSHMGFTVVFSTEKHLMTERLCTCGGKGIMDTVMYGMYKGSQVRTKCAPKCRWVKR
jgi:hypothetical protein